MQIIKKLTVALLAAAFLASPLTLLAGETNKPKAKAYPLDTCAVSGEKLGGMGDPYVFVHEGQEIKLCCKGCLKDFKKEPAKYLKKVAEAEKNKKKK